MANNPEGESCETCRFYGKPAGGSGQCRRHPPTVVATGGGVWPQVHQDDWCGEYQRDSRVIGDQRFVRG